MAHRSSSNATESKTDNRHQSNESETSERQRPESANGATDDRMRRAEELADRIGERVGHFASVVGLGILRFAARAREEAPQALLLRRAVDRCR